MKKFVFSAAFVFANFTIHPTQATGLLGKTSSSAQDSDPMEGSPDLKLLDARARLLRVPNLSSPACSLEIGKTFNQDTRSQGLQVISRFKVPNEVIAVVAQTGNDETAKVDTKNKVTKSLFEKSKYVFIVRFKTNEMKSQDAQKIHFQAFDPSYDKAIGLGFRPYDRKLVLSTTKSDLERVSHIESRAVKVEKQSLAHYSKVLYPQFRLSELEHFNDNDFALVEEGVKQLERGDKSYREIFNEKKKSFALEMSACKKNIP